MLLKKHENRLLVYSLGKKHGQLREFLNYENTKGHSNKECPFCLSFSGKIQSIE